jgi:deazaflavin-dependent oxidoreductase (nitroreductase family)
MDSRVTSTTAPLTARLHFVVRLLGPVHGLAIRLVRRHSAVAPGRVLVTTRGRKAGLPHTVLLPCARSHAGTIVVISTYGHRSDGLRNLFRDPRVEAAFGGRRVPARVEVVEGPARRKAIVAAHSFFPRGRCSPFSRYCSRSFARSS